MPATNTLLTSSIVLKEALLQLDNNLVMANLVYRDYSDEFVDKNGATVTIKKPPKYTVRDGATASPQDTTIGSTTVSVDKFKGVDLQFSTLDLTLSVDRFSELHIKPAMRALANQIDGDLFGLYPAVWNYVGTPGTTMGSFAAVARAAQRMDEMAMPMDRNMVVSPADNYGLLNNMTGLYINDVAKTALQKAKLPPLANFELYSGQNVATFTTGARGGTPVVNGASQATTYLASRTTNSQTFSVSGASNSITGWAKAGDVFTIAGCFAVNPVTGAALPYLQQFTVLSDANSNGSGIVSLTISPAIITAAPYKTVSAAPANSAALTFVGSASTGYPQNLAFCKEAFALVNRPLVMPEGVIGAHRETFKGISARIIPYYDGTNDLSNWRLDIIYGVKAVYPDLAARVAG
jgi:hypothetical protein